jgi:hypothetical protein
MPRNQEVIQKAFGPCNDNVLTVPTTGRQLVLSGCGVGQKTQLSQIPLPFSSNTIERPTPFINLDEPVSLAAFRDIAAEDDRVYVKATTGRGKHHGKHYYRLTISRHRVVQRWGRLYNGGRTGPEEASPDHNEVLINEWDWQTGNLVHYEDVKFLLNEHQQKREAHPDLAAHTDALYRYVMQQYDLSADYDQSGLILFWLSCFNLVRHHRTGKSFRPRLRGRSVSRALTTVFPGLERWEDIPLGRILRGNQ